MTANTKARIGRVGTVVMAVIVWSLALPALAEPTDYDGDWGDGGSVQLGDDIAPWAVFPDQDGASWVFGLRGLQVAEAVLFHIDDEGDVTEIDVDLPNIVAFEHAVRTPNGFAVAFRMNVNDMAVAKIDENGDLDPDFGVVVLGPVPEHFVLDLLPLGNRVVVAGSTAIDLFQMASVTLLNADGSIDSSFFDNGRFFDPNDCASSAVALFPASTGFEVVMISCEGFTTTELLRFTLGLPDDVLDTDTHVVTQLWSEFFDETIVPDGRRVIARADIESDFATSARLQLFTFGGPGFDEWIFDHEGLAISEPVLVADRASTLWALVEGGGDTLVVDTADGTFDEIESTARWVLDAATDWTTGNIYLAWNDGEITRSVADGSGRFTDDDGSVHEADIAELAASGIGRGCNPPLNTRFCGTASLTRGQMAALLVRAMDLPDGPDAFSDDDDSIFEDDINALAAAGITTGCTPDRYCPNAPVTRGQLAAFLNRALGLDPGPDAFSDDDGTVFEADIDALAASGIAKGCTPDRFCPEASVTREQMASFLVRADLAD